VNNEGYIQVGNVHAYVYGALRNNVATMLSYRKPGYMFSKAYRQGLWNGWIKVVDTRTGAFPAGLVPYVVAKLKEQGIHAPIADVREYPGMDYCLRPARNKVSLENYQLEAVESALRAERGVVAHATGSGKTEVMIELARRIGVKGLVLVHRRDLLYQTYDRFRNNLGIQGLIGIIGDGKHKEGCLTVATFQSLYHSLRQYPRDVAPFLKTIGQVHVDEVQHVSADSFGYVMKAIPNARWRFGYSATPFRSEGDREAFIRVVGWTGNVIHAMPPEGGIAAGRLVRADIFMLPSDGYADDSSWPSAYSSGIVHNKLRNDKIVELASRVRHSGPVLILVERVEHGRLLAERLRCPFLFGRTDSDTRSGGWQDVRDGKLDVVVASRIADEGLDIPNIRFLILAGGGKAGHVVIQRIGRGMRVSTGKDRLTVFDFVDPGKYLGQHSNERRKTYLAEGAYTLVPITFEELLNG
jgi:superfamily II DNA or RNA helicase